MELGFNLDRKKIKICISFPIAKKLHNTNIHILSKSDIIDFVV